MDTKTIQRRIAAILRQYPLSHAAVFGSAARNDER